MAHPLADEMPAAESQYPRTAEKEELFKELLVEFAVAGALRDFAPWTRCRKSCWGLPSVRRCWGKVGNRAMVWGAVAGTLPDMDVLGQRLNELDNFTFTAASAIPNGHRIGVPVFDG